MQESQKTIAILTEKEYQDLEVWYPYYRLKEAGFDSDLIAPRDGKLTGKYGYPLDPDQDVKSANPADYTGVIIPGGFAPDYMRRNEHMVDFVADMNNQNKLVAAICHGVWMLAEADIIRNRDVTSFSGIQTDIKNAGGNVFDKTVVRDENIITSRNPDDLPTFLQAIVKYIKAK